MKKIFSVLGFIILAFVLVSGVFAGGKKDTGAKPIEITILTRATEAEQPQIYQTIAAFKKANEGKIVVIENHISDEQANLDRMRTGFAAGNPPNIFHGYGGSREYLYAKNGQLVNLDSVIEADKEWSGKFLNLWDKWQYPDVPGTFGVPYEMVASTLFINTQIFQECGLQDPVTIEDFERCCDALLRRGYIPLALGEKDIWRAGHFFNFLVMKSIGADGVTRLANRTLRYDSPEIRNLIQKIYDYNQKGYFGPNAVSVDYQQEQILFFTGKSAMHFDGTWSLGMMNDAEVVDNIKPVPFPYINPAKATSTFGNAIGLSITKNTPAVEEASLSLVKALSSEDYFLLLYRLKSGQLLPAKVNQAQLDRIPVSRIFKETKAIVDTGTEFRDDVQTYDPVPSLLDTVRYSLQGLFVGKTVDQCIAEIMNEIATR